jgi:hypothetical protein
MNVIKKRFILWHLVKSMDIEWADVFGIPNNRMVRVVRLPMASGYNRATDSNFPPSESQPLH